LLKNVPFVYDIQDLWPDTISASNMMSNSFILRGLNSWCSFVYRQADHLTVLSQGFRRTLIERGVPEAKISLIYNWCDEENIRPQDRDEGLAQRLRLIGRFNVMYAGTMGPAQALDSVLEAAAFCATANPKIQFVFVGGGIERADLEAKAARSPNVLFLPHQSTREISSLLALADVLLVHLKDDPLFRMTIPSKTQAFLAASKPILMAVSGDAADLVQRAQAGVTVGPENAREIAQAVLGMAQLAPDRLAEMGSRGRAFYLREMSMEAGIRRFEELFLTVSQQGRKLALPQDHIRSTP
jgi:glycosyltransferase involved in cell wall biosynthesis